MFNKLILFIFTIPFLIFSLIFNFMTEQEKAMMYGHLLNEHTRLHNKINEIKSQDLDLTPKNQTEVRKLEAQQMDIMRKIRMLFTK